MAVPASDLGDLLLAKRTKTGLFLPEMLKPSSSLERRKHLHIKPFLEVGFPSRIVRVGLRTNFQEMLKQGLRPFAVGAIGEVVIAGFTLGLVYGADKLFGW